jgi:hypothetical protein
MKTEWDVTEIFNRMWSKFPVGTEIHPRDMVHMIELYTGYQRSPHDGTITRYMRTRRKTHKDIMLVSKPRSLYKKVSV